MSGNGSCSGDGWWHESRQDVFAGVNNHNLDFGIISYGAAIWEIADSTNGGRTGSHGSITTENRQNFWLGVDVVFDAQNQRHVNCYCITKDNADRQDAESFWQLDYSGSGKDYQSDRFYLGGDADAGNIAGWPYEPFYGKIFIKQCYLLQKGTNAGNPKGKYILKPAP